MEFGPWKVHLAVMLSASVGEVLLSKPPALLFGLQQWDLSGLPSGQQLWVYQSS